MAQSPRCPLDGGPYKPPFGDCATYESIHYINGCWCVYELCMFGPCWSSFGCLVLSSSRLSTRFSQACSLYRSLYNSKTEGAAVGVEQRGYWLKNLGEGKRQGLMDPYSHLESSSRKSCHKNHTRHGPKDPRIPPSSSSALGNGLHSENGPPNRLARVAVVSLVGGRGLKAGIHLLGPLCRRRNWKGGIHWN